MNAKDYFSSPFSRSGSSCIYHIIHICNVLDVYAILHMTQAPQSFRKRVLDRGLETGKEVTLRGYFYTYVKLRPDL